MSSTSLLSKNLPPLAERIRPQVLSEFIGQANLIHENSLLTKAVVSKQPFSLIFWGPPGTGKTTLARILSREFEVEYFELSAISSGVKVGVTRSAQIPTRWIDQGAWQAIKLAKTPNRYTAGLIEIALKEYISDRTQWQRMLKNQLVEGVDLRDKKKEMLNYLSEELIKYECEDNDITEIIYPVKEYPDKVKSLSFDKLDEIAGRLWGIKGQYLIFDDGTVLNVRKHTGYLVVLEV